MVILLYYESWRLWPCLSTCSDRCALSYLSRQHITFISSLISHVRAQPIMEANNLGGTVILDERQWGIGDSTRWPRTPATIRWPWTATGGDLLAADRSLDGTGADMWTEARERPREAAPARQPWHRRRSVSVGRRRRTSLLLSWCYVHGG
jgi:hypothetical protein